MIVEPEFVDTTDSDGAPARTSSDRDRAGAFSDNDKSAPTSEEVGA